MRNKVARRLRKLANWHPSEGKWFQTEEQKLESITFNNQQEKVIHLTKNPTFAAYQTLKAKYKTLGTPMYSQDKGAPRR